MSPVARPRTFQHGRQPQLCCCCKECLRVHLPGIAVKVRCQKEAGFVLEHRIYAHHEVAALRVAAGKVPRNNLIGNRKELAVWTIRTLDARLLANPADPFVATSRRISCPAGLATLKTPGIEIASASEQ